MELVLQRPNDLARAALEAYTRIQPYVRRTPVQPSRWLASSGGAAEVFLKLESEQHTQSFKARGALNKIMSLTPQQLSKGLVTCSTGNHALAFVWACSGYQPAQHAPSTIYLPTTASPAKVSRLQAQGAHLCHFSDDCAVAEVEARRAAGEQGWTYISPYNDWEVMAGQGTVAVELLQQLSPQGVDAIIVPVGGGGLIGGIAAVVKAWNPDVQVIGVQPAASDVMRQSVTAGRIVDAPSSETLSDATAGGIEEGAITLDPCMQYVDTWVTVSEQEIADAMVSLLHHHSKLVEGAAGCAVAAAMNSATGCTGLAGKRVAVVCCGGNVAVTVLRGVLEQGRVCE